MSTPKLMERLKCRNAHVAVIASMFQSGVVWWVSVVSRPIFEPIHVLGLRDPIDGGTWVHSAKSSPLARTDHMPRHQRRTNKYNVDSTRGRVDFLPFLCNCAMHCSIENTWPHWMLCPSWQPERMRDTYEAHAPRARAKATWAAFRSGTCAAPSHLKTTLHRDLGQSPARSHGSRRCRLPTSAGFATKRGKMITKTRRPGTELGMDRPSSEQSTTQP